MPVDAAGLRELYDHHAWALDRALARAAEVSPEQAVARPWRGVPSLRDALAHVVTAERAWLRRWQDGGLPAWAARHPDPWTVTEVAERWSVVQAETRAFIAGLGEAELVRLLRMPRAFPSPFRPVGGEPQTLAAGVMHVLLHAAQHRAEAAALLSEYGHSPGGLDYIDFLETREAVFSGPPLR